MTVLANVSSNPFPPPLWGRDRVGGKAWGATGAIDSVGSFRPPTLTLPHKGGGDFSYRLLADIYQARQILTSKFYDDGLHIGLATVVGVDVLVSWNFKHIVHLDKIQRFNAIHQEQGYKPIQIYSSREVTKAPTS